MGFFVDNMSLFPLYFFFVLIKIHYDTESSLSGSAPLQKKSETELFFFFRIGG